MEFISQSLKLCKLQYVAGSKFEKIAGISSIMETKKVMNFMLSQFILLYETIVILSLNEFYIEI